MGAKSLISGLSRLTDPTVSQRVSAGICQKAVKKDAPVRFVTRFSGWARRASGWPGLWACRPRSGVSFTRARRCDGGGSLQHPADGGSPGRGHVAHAISHHDLGHGARDQRIWRILGQIPLERETVLESAYLFTLYYAVLIG
jgi:hypothetical protein